MFTCYIVNVVSILYMFFFSGSNCEHLVQKKTESNDNLLNKNPEYNSE